MGDHVEEVSEGGRRVLRRGVYLLPNLLTTGSLLGGFLAAINALGGNLYYAAIAVYVALIFDVLDGRAARITHTESTFGMHYDSLSDLVSCGVAPALILFQWGLAGIQSGWVFAFVLVACASLRLARFNTQAGIRDERFFSGMPTGPAAAIAVSTVLVLGAQPAAGSPWLAAPLMVALGMLMVMDIPYYSFKDIDFLGRVPFGRLLLVVLLLVVIALNPPLMLLLLGAVYAGSGPVLFLWRHRKSWRRKLT